jgi:wingless-type MMTV integration site family protein 11
MPNFGIIGNMLKSKYISAVEVKRKRRNSKKVFVSINPNRKTVTSDSLIYYTKSPDYCSRDPKTGSLGTEER